MVPLIWSSLQIFWQNLDGAISNFGISGQLFIKENCHNARTIDDIGMKLGPVTKIDKRNKTVLKKLTMVSYQQIVTSLSCFQFIANFEQSRSQIPDA